MSKVITKKPLVSVLMITYNHEQYLADAIEGIINQICDFDFELLIGEDCSQDNTREVALEYEKKHPNLIRVIYSEKNIGMNANSKRIFDQARGEYIAYCEGDDFWCDQTKLSQQVKLIEKDSNVCIVHSDWTRANLIHGNWTYNYHKSVHSYTHKKYLQGDLSNTWHYPKILRTCTILLRRQSLQEWYDSGLMKNSYHFGDCVLHLWITHQGHVAYLPTVTAVYRVSPNSALRSGTKARIAFYRSALQFASDANNQNIQHYRWDNIIALILWGIRGKDHQAIKEGFKTLKQNYSISELIKIAFQTLFMRIPTFRKQKRAIPKSKPYGISQKCLKSSN